MKCCKAIQNSLLLLTLLIFAACSSGPKKVDTGTTAAKPASKATSTAADKSTTTAAAANADNERTTKCKMAQDERDLWLEKKSPAGCVLKYRKFGQTSNLGESEVDLSYCRKMQAKIVGNLTSAGFTCQSDAGPKKN